MPLTSEQYRSLNRRKPPFKPPVEKIVKQKGFSGVLQVEIKGLMYEQVMEDGGWVEIKMIK